MSTAEPSQPSGQPAIMAWRLLAMLYDGVIAIALLFVISVLSLAIKPDHRPVEPGTLAAYAVFAGLWGVIGVYAVLSWRRGGQTIGMKPWRLIITDQHGRRAGWQALCIRFVLASCSLGLVLLWCLFDGQRRGLHDIAAGTVLLRMDAKSA
jgi:uncharacterized RDD family membrane protein YckC